MSVLYRGQSDLLSSALLASLLWSELTGVRVVVQVFNDTALPAQHQHITDTISSNNIEVRWGQNTEAEGNSVCDGPLRERLSRFLLYSALPQYVYLSELSPD